MTEPRPLRLFLAVSVPQGHLDWVGRQVAGLADRWPDARWIPGENQHVTLKFLGATSTDLLDPVASACREAAKAQTAGSVSLEGLGVFPSAKRARVLWIGLHDPGRLLASVAGALDGRLRPLGFQPEKRAFSPHLTIARFKSPTPVGELPPLSASPGLFQVAEFGLWRSDLSPKGARYECLRSFELGT